MEIGEIFIAKKLKYWIEKKTNKGVVWFGTKNENKKVVIV